MKLTQLKFPGLDIFIDLQDISYMEQEIKPQQTSLIIQPTEKNYYTRISLKSGKTIMVENSIHDIVKMINEELL